MKTKKNLQAQESKAEDESTVRRPERVIDAVRAARGPLRDEGPIRVQSRAIHCIVRCREVRPAVPPKIRYFICKNPPMTRRYLPTVGIMSGECLRPAARHVLDRVMLRCCEARPPVVGLGFGG